MPARPLQRRQGSRRIVETTARGFQNRAADASASRSNRREYPNRGVETASAASSSISEASPTATIETARTRPPTRRASPWRSSTWADSCAITASDSSSPGRSAGSSLTIAGPPGNANASAPSAGAARKRIAGIGSTPLRQARTRGIGNAPPPVRRNADRTKQRSVHSVERSPSHLRFQASGNQDDGEIGRERNRGAQSENARDRQEGDRL